MKMGRARRGSGKTAESAGNATEPLRAKTAVNGTLAGALDAVYLFGLLGAEEEAAWISGWEPIVLGDQADPKIGRT